MTGCPHSLRFDVDPSTCTLCLEARGERIQIRRASASARARTRSRASQPSARRYPLRLPRIPHETLDAIRNTFVGGADRARRVAR